jgi:molybdate transport system substrate-binding protein
MTLRSGIAGACALAAVIAIAGFSPARSSKGEVAIAAAANLNEVCQIIGPRFEAATGIHPVFSFASTAQLALQIEHAAPFDVFAAADVEHVEQLEKKGFLASGSKAVYATGILALWIPPGAGMKIDNVSDITQPSVRVIALAKPELAPYGLAARESLQRLGIWDQVQPRIVYADNISMAKQYGASGNADAVFTAYSLVMKESGKAIPVDEQLHRPIDQALAIIAASRHAEAAREFADFLLKGEGRNILGNSGYRLPSR